MAVVVFIKVFPLRKRVIHSISSLSGIIFMCCDVRLNPQLIPRFFCQYLKTGLLVGCAGAAGDNEVLTIHLQAGQQNASSIA